MKNSSRPPLFPEKKKQFITKNIEYIKIPFNLSVILELKIIIVLCIILAILVFVVFKNKGKNESDVIIQLTNSLSNQIQNIRKEINDNSEKSRLEIESKLKVINKEISDFQISSKSSIQKQFAEEII